MREFEILIEDINPCGGSQFAKRELFEAQAESPEDYVVKHGRFPIMEQRVNADGDTVIITGSKDIDGVDYLQKAWAQPDVCLYNKEGLPAFPFSKTKAQKK